ncbi:MAG: sulfotransferase [Xanthomonadales bacterium]|nr:sulfotransferase [Xanthomonadales bacterium]
MQSITLESETGRKYVVSIDDPKPGLKSSYVFAFARGGSTLLNGMIEAYCNYVNVPTFSLFNSAFDQGVHTSEIQEDSLKLFKKTGYVYTGFRHFPLFNMDIKGAPVVWLVRDPRDILVSLYYSILKSHVIPKGLVSLVKSRKATEKTDINQFVLNRAKTFNQQFQRYQKMLVSSDLKIYKYEDVIYEKEIWLTDIIAKLGIEYNPRLVRNIARDFNILPKKENNNKHIRQVHPGNHTTKLESQTIQELNKVLSEFLTCFGYID